MKWIGFLIILAGSAGMGFSGALDYKKRIETLTHLQRMMHYMQEMVALEKLPLPEAVARCRERMDGIYETFLGGVTEQLSRFEGEDIALVWHDQAEKLRPCLTKHDFPAFYHCMDQTGFACASSQAEAIRQYEKALSRDIAKLNEEREEKCRLYQSLGIIGGIFICILLF